MKKSVGLFFLLNFIFTGVALADDTTNLTLPSDYRSTQVLAVPALGSVFTFDFEGNFIFAKPNGSSTQIIKMTASGETTVLVDRVSQPITGLSFHKGKVYVVFRGRIDVVNRGTLSDVVSGLPASGDYSNSTVIFGDDDKMYFSVGTATNSGIVGSDNIWLKSNPSVHDLLCPGFTINQTNIQTDNFLTAKRDDKANTGAFMPFNTPDYTDTLPVSDKCNGVIMRANADGTDLEIVATGLHNVKGLSFDTKNNLYALDSAMENRGVRPISNGKDSLFAVNSGKWYGWPDYNAGEKVGNAIIKSPSSAEKPIATFDPGLLSQFVVSQFDASTGLVVNDSKIEQLNLTSGKLFDFGSLPTGYKVNQMKFGPDKNLYLLMSDGKTSRLMKIESTRHAVLAPAGTTSGSRKNLLAIWSISLSVMGIGMLGTYVIYKNRQETIL